MLHFARLGPRRAEMTSKAGLPTTSASRRGLSLSGPPQVFRPATQACHPTVAYLYNVGHGSRFRVKSAAYRFRVCFRTRMFLGRRQFHCRLVVLTAIDSFSSDC